jgi:putative ABC transport system permease protein
MMNEFLLAVRSLLRSPGYAAAAILTLAVGIGASTAMFSLIHAALLRPLPYSAPDRLLTVQDRYTPSGGGGSLRTGNFMDMRRESQTVDLAAYDASAFNVATEERPEHAAGLRVTSDFTRVLGVAPLIGRAFTPEENESGRADVVIISHRMWQERFDGGQSVLGGELTIDATPHEVIGVLPADFWFPGEPQLLIPFSFTPEAMEQRGSRWLQAIARMRPGVTEAQAQSELATIFAGIAERFPEGNTDWTVQTRSFTDSALGASRSSLILLNGAVLLLLLIGSLNVANLMLVRAERRAREMAVRVALGAGRGRIAAQYFGEALLLAASGAVLGVMLAVPATRALVALFGSTLPRVSDVGISVPVLLFSILLSLLAACLVVLVPLLRMRRTDIQQTLRDGGRGLARQGGMLQQALVAGQVALAVVLVSGAALLVHSFIRLNAVDAGIDVENALVFSVRLPAAVYDTPEKAAAFHQQTLAGILALPGVRSAGVSERTPLQGGMNVTTVASPLDPGITSTYVEIRTISPDFFAAAGIPLHEGRGITEDDIRQERRVIVVNDELARELFHDRSAVGQRLLEEWDGGFEIVGVVGSVREFGVTNEKRPGMYFPLKQFGVAGSMVYVVRTAGDPMAAVPGIRNAVAAEDAAVPIHRVRRLKDVFRETTGSRWLAANLFTAFGALALALAAIGIFGVLAYVVEQRTRDIGIRMALGASGSRVQAMVVWQGLKLALIGLAGGVAAATLGGSLIADLLWEVEATDAATLAIASAVALVTAAAAAFLPALRATRIPPAVALTAE